MKALTKWTIDQYVERGLLPGGFVTAVMANDLMAAFGRADEDNRHDLFEICQYVYNHCPSLCWGSPEIVKSWIEKGGLQGHGKETNNSGTD